MADFGAWCAGDEVEYGRLNGDGEGHGYLKQSSTSPTLKETIVVVRVAYSDGMDTGATEVLCLSNSDAVEAMVPFVTQRKVV